MGLKCSVLGHRFEEPGLVHEREQRGTEVIIIKRKVRICILCGEQRILAESKEITKQIDDDSDTVLDDGDDSDSTVTNDESVTETTTVNEHSGDDTSASESMAVSGLDTVYDDTTVDDPESTIVNLQRTEDDGVVLTDDDTGRDYGEWPTEPSETESDASWESDVGEIPSPASDRTTGDATSFADIDDDGEIIETMDESTDETVDGQPPDGTLACQTCDFSVSASDSPFRSGDICPGCHESYLTDGL